MSYSVKKARSLKTQSVTEFCVKDGVLTLENDLLSIALLPLTAKPKQ